MAVKIRLNRIGTKKRPYYRIVAIDSRAPRNGAHIEILGTYDPKNLAVPQHSTAKSDTGLLNVKTDRIQYWLSKGATPSPTMASILRRLKIAKPTSTAAA